MQHQVQAPHEIHAQLIEQARGVQKFVVSQEPVHVIMPLEVSYGEEQETGRSY